jgi:glycosyltransferase involved in cell wall biosynthesis
MVSASSEEQKGHAVFADALAGAPGVRGVMVGSPPPPRVAARIGALGLRERLVVAGRLPEVGPLFHAIDVLVVPSTADESLPLVVLEAMAAGVPVFASRLSGIPEAVVDGETGRLFEPGDSATLAGLMNGAAGDRSTLAPLGTAGRARWVARYSLDAMNRALLDLYAAPPARRVRPPTQ